MGAVADGAQAVEQCTRLLSEVVLMDLEMPVMDGIEATKRIVTAQPHTAVVILTALFRPTAHRRRARSRGMRVSAQGCRRGRR